MDSENTRMLLVGELSASMTLAGEMIKGSDGSISVGTADCESFNHWCRALRKVAVVDVTMNVNNLIRRLRDDVVEMPDPAAAIEQLVGQSVEQVERALILRSLERCGGNRTAAAAMLGISVRTMRNKLRSFLSEDVTPPSALSHS